MAPPNRIIIDTDPGTDDVLAMLLAFSAHPDELEVLLVSVTFGNVDVQCCLRNIVTLFHIIGKEQEWRRQNGKPEGFETLKARKPIVAIGADEPLAEQMMVADYFHGIDGLGGTHTSHPHLSPPETWKTLFAEALKSSNPEELAAACEMQDADALFIPSQRPSHEEMLRILRENEPNTITIVAIGPQTTVAHAAYADPETFLRVKEVVVMGGAVDVPGNMTPGGEFNIYADSVAAARVFALTSPTPSTTMPPNVPGGKGYLGPYPDALKKLNLKLFPLDVTTQHLFLQSLADASLSTGSPLATWMNAFLSSAFRKITSLMKSPPADVGLEMHDPLTIWYCLTSNDPKWRFITEDIRVESSGQWTRGCCITDRRGRAKRVGEPGAIVASDTGEWLNKQAGNRIERCLESPGADIFAKVLLERIFGRQI